MLKKIFYENTLKDWGISLIIILGAIILCKGFIFINKHVIGKYTKKSKSRLGDILFSSIEKPVLLGIILIAVWIATNRLDLGDKISSFILKAYKILPVLNFTWFVSMFLTALIDEHSSKQRRKKQIENKLLPLIKRTVIIIVWIIGIVSALGNLDIEIAAILGTLGLGGVAIALASQDTIKNIFGGVTIFTDNPFRIGDLIRFDNIEGTVRDIGIRSTRITTADKRIITVPNYKIMDASITNISAEPGRRVLINLSLVYNTAPEKMAEAITLLKGLPTVIPGIEPNVTATFSNFGDSSLEITYIYFIRKSADIRETISKVNFEILTAFNNAEVEFAYPTQTIYMGKD